VDDEGIVDAEGVVRVTPEFWHITQDFLVTEKTGRVTWHIDHGIVQTVETTVYLKRRSQKDVVVQARKA
jgi:hypothetical protein